MKKNKSTIILILVFFVGLSVMLYPPSAITSTSCISPVLWPPMPRMWTI
mgnify:CR=1 FL=1